MTIIITPLDNLRPIHQGSSEIGNRYQQLKNLLKDGSYKLLAEPEYLSAGEIEWKTELSGDVVQYTQADEKMQESMLIQLKQQVMTILNQENIKDNEEIQEYLSLILEIPDLSNIYAVNDHIVLCNWGYIEDKYNAERGIIKKLIDGVLFTVNIEDEDGVIISELPIQVKYGQDSSEYITNDDGQILLDVIYGSSVDIHIDLQNDNLYKDNNISKNIVCLKEKTEETIVLKLAEVIISRPLPEQTWFSKNKKKLLGLFVFLLFLMIGIFLLLTLQKETTITVYDKQSNQIIQDVKVSLTYIQEDLNKTNTYKTDSKGELSKKFSYFLNKMTIKTDKAGYFPYSKSDMVIEKDMKIYLEKITKKDIKITVYDKSTNQVIQDVNVAMNYQKDGNSQTQRDKTNSNGEIKKVIPYELVNVSIEANKSGYHKYNKGSMRIAQNIKIYMDKLTEKDIAITVYDKKTNQVISGVEITLNYQKGASSKTQQDTTNSSGQIAKTLPYGLGTIAVKTFKYGYDEYQNSSVLVSRNIKIYLNKPEKAMIIPKTKPKDFAFAAGLWKSTTEIVDTSDSSIKMVYYFNLKKNGRGTLLIKNMKTMVTCKAKLKLSFSNKKLKIKYLKNKRCKSYCCIKDNFSCKATQNGIATCIATNRNNLYFSLIKQ